MALHFLHSLLRQVGPCLALSLTGLGCNAPRDNPLDPGLGGNIEGRVLTRSALPIHNAYLELLEAGRLARSDSSGRFGLYNLPVGTFLLRCSADSFAPDSSDVVLAKGRIDTLTLELDGLPFFRFAQLTSHTYYRSEPPDHPLSFCLLRARVGDHDGDADLDSVWISIPVLRYHQRLGYDPDQQAFVGVLWANSLPESTLESLVGQDVQFKVTDKAWRTVTSEPHTVGRIIYGAPERVFPIGGQGALTSDTTFIWRRFARGYPVHYHNEIIRIEAGSPAGLSDSFNTPKTNDTTHRVRLSTFVPGDYYWTLEAIDDLGNSVRTAEEHFSVH